MVSQIVVKITYFVHARTAPAIQSDFRARNRPSVVNSFTLAG